MKGNNRRKKNERNTKERKKEREKEIAKVSANNGPVNAWTNRKVQNSIAQHSAVQGTK